MMNTNVAALASIKTVNNTKIFNETTSGLDLAHPEFSLDAFEQKANGFRVVIEKGLVVMGLEAALSSEESEVLFVDSLDDKMVFVSALSDLLRYGAEGFVPGYHPAYIKEGSNRLVTTIGYIRSNYDGTDFGLVPEDGLWYPVVARPVAGQGTKLTVGKKALDFKSQGKHDATDLLVDGQVIAGYWPKGLNKNGEGIVKWLGIVLGHNQAIIDSDEELIAIHNTRYMEAVSDKKLNSKARVELRGKSDEELNVVAAAGTQELVMTTINGDALIFTELGSGSPVRFYNGSGRYQGQQTWNPENAYSVQKFQEAAKMGWAVQVLFDTNAM